MHELNSTKENHNDLEEKKHCFSLNTDFHGGIRPCSQFFNPQRIRKKSAYSLSMP